MKDRRNTSSGDVSSTSRNLTISQKSHPKLRKMASSSRSALSQSLHSQKLSKNSPKKLSQKKTPHTPSEIMI